jgi:hypothetical protein
LLSRSRISTAIIHERKAQFTGGSGEEGTVKAGAIEDRLIGEVAIMDVVFREEPPRKEHSRNGSLRKECSGKERSRKEHRGHARKDFRMCDANRCKTTTF